jgi:alpha-1,3-rhamnosyl/mannosyltransferase
MTATRVAVNTLSVTEANEGIRTVLVRLLPALHRVAPDLHQVLVCSRANRGLLEEHASETGAELVEVPLEAGRVLKRIRFDQVDVPRLARDRADVLFTPSSVGSLRSAIPQVVFVQAHLALPSCRALGGTDSLSRLHRFYYGPLLRRSLRGADAVLANSAFVADGLVEELGIARRTVRAMPLGVEPPEGTATPAERAASAEPIVLFVGTLYEYKDARVAIRAFAVAQPGLVAGARLVIVGRDPDGTQARALREEADRLGLGDAVELVGSVSDEELGELYRRAMVLLMPSRCEGFGLPVAEAMAAGTPVVVADATALPEVAGGAGVLVPVGDVPGFADALLRVMGDADLRASLIERGLARSRELSWDATASILRDAIVEVAP